MNLFQKLFLITSVPIVIIYTSELICEGFSWRTFGAIVIQLFCCLNQFEVCYYRQQIKSLNFKINNFYHGK